MSEVIGPRGLLTIAVVTLVVIWGLVAVHFGNDPHVRRAQSAWGLFALVAFTAGFSYAARLSGGVAPSGLQTGFGVALIVSLLPQLSQIRSRLLSLARPQRYLSLVLITYTVLLAAGGIIERLPLNTQVPMLLLPLFFLSGLHAAHERIPVRSLILVSLGLPVFASLAMAALQSGLAFHGTSRSDSLIMNGQLYGVTPHPNLLAMFSTLFVAVALGVHHRGWKATLVATGIVCTLLTGSRAGLLSLIVIGLITALTFFRARIGPLLIAFAAMGVSVWFAESWLTQAFAAPADTGVLNGRGDVWHSAVDLLTSGNWFGVGSDPTSIESALSGVGVVFLHAHNQFLEGVVEAGVVGGLTLAAAFCLMIWSIVSAIRSGALENGLVLSVLGVWSISEVPLSGQLYGVSVASAMAALFAFLVTATSPRETDVDEVSLQRTALPFGRSKN